MRGSRSEFGTVVPRRRAADGCGLGRFVSLSTPRREVCVLHEERARGLETRRSRQLVLAAHCVPRRGGRSALRARARFGRIWAAMRFLLFALREGASALQAAWRAVAVEQPSLVLAVSFGRARQSFDPGCTGQIGKFRRVNSWITGFFYCAFR